MNHGKVRLRLRSEMQDFLRRHPEMAELEEWKELEEAARLLADAHADLHQRVGIVKPRDCRRCQQPLQGTRDGTYVVNGIVVSAFQMNETLYRCANVACVDHGVIDVYQNMSGNLVFRFPPPSAEGHSYSPDETVREAIMCAYSALCRVPFAGAPLYTPGTTEHTLLEAAALTVGAITEEDLTSSENQTASVDETAPVFQLGSSHGKQHMPFVISQAFGISTSEGRRLLALNSVRLDQKPLTSHDVDVDALDGKVLKVSNPTYPSRWRTVLLRKPGSGG